MGCCKPRGPASAWYPVSRETECRKESVKCTNRYGDEFECANGDHCCGDICVSKNDVCCENVLGNYFPCQGKGGGCCGNACFAPGSKCCKSPFVAKGPLVPSHPGYQMCFRLVLKLAPHVADEVSGPGSGCSYLTNPTLCDAKLRLVAKFGKLDSARRRLANFGAGLS